MRRRIRIAGGRAVAIRIARAPQQTFHGTV